MPSTLSHSLARTTAIRILRSLPPTASSVSEDPSSSNAEKSVDPILISNEYDRESILEDLEHQFALAGFIDVAIVPVSLQNVVAVAEALEQEMLDLKKQAKMTTQPGSCEELVVLQLCDGTELDGYPGLSMVRELEQRKIPFTGSDSTFYIATTSKPILKRELQAAHVPTSGFQEFKAFPATEKKEQTDEDGKGDDSLDSIVDSIGFPMIVKPSISYASINISLSSVVHNRQELVEQVKQSLATCSIGSDSLESNSDIEESNNEEDRYRHETEAEGLERRVRGWEKEILRPTVFVERFLAGREFTVLVVGDRHWGVTVYPAAERVFKPSLGKYERLLAFEQYWEGCGLDWKEDNTEDYCRYQLADETWQKSLQQVAKDAFLAVHGSGYGRVDIRTVEMDKCEPVVLEVNANCGLSFQKDTTSMANILLMTETSPRQFLYNLVDHALCRNRRLNGGEKETNRLVQIQDCSHESTGLHTKQKPLVLGGESTADLASELEFTLDRVQAEVDDIQRQIELEVRSCRERTESVELLVQS